MVYLQSLTAKHKFGYLPNDALNLRREQFNLLLDELVEVEGVGLAIDVHGVISNCGKFDCKHMI